MARRDRKPSWLDNPGTRVRWTVWPVVLLAVLGVADVEKFFFRAASAMEPVGKAGIAVAALVVCFFSLAAIGIVGSLAAGAIRKAAIPTEKQATPAPPRPAGPLSPRP